MPIAEREGDVWLRWEEHGPSDGAPVLLVMGLGGSAKPWWRLIPHLQDRFRVIAFDNRGTGDSSRVRGALSMRDLTQDALAVMDAADLDDAHVVGMSMGGMIAQHLALDHRDRVRSLILGCTTPAGRSGGPSWRLLSATALRPVIGPQRTFTLVAPALYAPSTLRNHPSRVAEDVRVRAAEATPGATLLAQMSAISGHDTRTRLAELAGLPVTVIHGEEDRLVSPDRGRELAAGIPGARLVTIPDCGHLMGTDAEAETSAAILGHLDRAAARSSARAS